MFPGRKQLRQVRCPQLAASAGDGQGADDRTTLRAEKRLRDILDLSEEYERGQSPMLQRLRAADPTLMDDDHGRTSRDD